MKTEDWALLVSVISMLISFWTLRQEKKMNQVNLQADYYKKVFEKYLMKEIPSSVRMLSFNEKGFLSREYKKVNEVLIDMLDECAYFAYANNSFYEEIRERVTRIDEKLVLISGQCISSKEEQNKFIYEVHLEIQKMIKKINKAYMS